jgi:hypothetical protein
MATIKFTNFARTTLAIGAASGATSLTLASGTGSRFPTLGVDEYFYMTLENASLVREIVKVTARAGDLLTIVRAQDNTTAQTWNAGDVASLRFNAAAISDSVTNKVSYTVPVGSAILPKGTTAERDGSPATGYLRYNETTGQFEGYGVAGWGSIGGGAVANGTLLETGHTISSNYTLSTGTSAVNVGGVSVATGQALTVPTGEAVVSISTAGIPAANNVTPITTGNQIIYGDKTFAGRLVMTGGVSWNASATPSMVRVNTANGYGSTNTVIRRFTNVVTNQGTDITYADSATLGATFTINVAGVYGITFCDSFATAAWGGASLNSIQLTTSIATITSADVLCYAYEGGGVGQGIGCATTVYIPAGSVVRAHTSGAAYQAGIPSLFTITRVA